jgi:hypothetical protein
MAERWVKVAAAPDETDALLMDGVLKDAKFTIGTLLKRRFRHYVSGVLGGSLSLSISFG